MKIASRFDEKYKYEKCPACNEISSNFLIISETMLACLKHKCGAVFIRQAVLEQIDIKQMLIEQEIGFSCVCGKVFKKEPSLRGHKMTCKEIKSKK